MKTTQRVRRAGLATVAALVIGGSGVAVGTAIADPATLAVTAARPGSASTVPSATPGPVVPGSYAGPASYAGVVRQVLPSVVLIRTADGLGSGVVLDSKGNIVTNAHVAGLSLVRVAERSGLQPGGVVGADHREVVGRVGADQFGGPR
ncbi:MAG TPA: hypothetical protein VGU21_01075 [Streptosporangiaceae bacterium]|nr:hypothetical protein [Streptosporangiaceae bacterium]